MKATSKLTLTEYVVHHKGVRMGWSKTKPVFNRDLAKKIERNLQSFGHVTMLEEVAVPEVWHVPSHVIE